MSFPSKSLFNFNFKPQLKLFSFVFLFISYFIIVSTSDCGKLKPIPGDIRTFSPWTCAVFTRTEQNELKFFSTGTIIGPNTVVTVARGPFGSILKGSKESKVLPHPSIFVVAAGVNSTDFKLFDDHRQLSDVNYLEPDVTEDDSNEHFHFMIFHLKTLFDFRSPYVKAVCLFPEDSVNRVSPTGWEFVSSGFIINGLKAKSAVLNVTTIQTFSTENCSSYYRFHYRRDYEESQIYCGKKSKARVDLTALNSESATATRSAFGPFSGRQSCFLHGSVNVFQVGDRWSLGGIVVLIPERRRGKCNDNSVYIYAQTKKHLSWMKSSVSCGPDKFSCGDAGNTCIPVTTLCNRWSNCPDGKDELESLCIAQNRCVDEGLSNQTYSCGVTSNCIRKAQVCDSNIDCLDGIDEDDEFCFQFRAKQPSSNCPRLKMPRGATASCSNNVTGEDCLGLIVPDTKIKFYCPEFHESIYWYTSFETTCDGESGAWLNKLPFACSAECGIFPPLAKSWISNQTFERNLPWNGYIFAPKRFKEGIYPPLCSAVFIDFKFAIIPGECLKKWNLTPDVTFLLWEPVSTDGVEYLLEQNVYSQSVTAKQFWFVPNIYGEDLDLVLVKHEPPHSEIGYDLPGQGIPTCYIQTSQQFRNASLVNAVGRVMYLAENWMDVERWQRIEAVDFKVLSYEECAAYFGPRNVPDYTFCARPFGKWPVLPPRDVGTGFYILKRNADYGEYQFYLKGLACNPKYPVKQNISDGLQLFVNTDKMLDWIIDVMENNY